MLHLLRNRLAGRLARTVAVCGLALAAPLAAQDDEETSEVPFLFEESDPAAPLAAQDAEETSEVPFLFEESDPAEYDLAPLDGYWVVESTEIDGEERSTCFEKIPIPLADAGLPSGECSGDCSTSVRKTRRSFRYPGCQSVKECAPMDQNGKYYDKLCPLAKKEALSQAAAKCEKTGGKDCGCWSSRRTLFLKRSCKPFYPLSNRNECKYECRAVLQGTCKPGSPK